MRFSKTSQLAFALWLPAALGLTLIAAFAYWGIQQNYRLGANDPQIQMSEDAVKDLSQVPDISQLAGSLAHIDISQTLGSFIVVFDESGKPVLGNGYINDQLPTLPKGVFDTAKKRSDYRFTWQPNKNLRFAAVLRHYTGTQNGFIMAARSLREVEKSEKQLMLGAGIAWLAAMLLSLMASWSVAKYLVKHFAAHDHIHEHHTA